jgi:hypothetical protein
VSDTSAGSEVGVQQGQGGIGSRKHGVSGHASKSPRFRLMNRLTAERGEFGEFGGPARRRRGLAFASVRDLFKVGRKPR